MPQPPFPPTAVPGGGDLPVSSAADVVALLPKGMQQPQTAPVRDALVAGLTQIAISWQEAAAYAAAQADIGRSTDQFLVGEADDRGFKKSATENDATFRARALTVPTAVSRTAIAAAVNAILSKYTTVQCRVFDSILDRMYVFNGSGANTNHCYVSAPNLPSGNRFSGPNYPDRLYPEYAAQNGGSFLPNSSPGGAWAFGDCIGRYLVVRIPDLSPINSVHAYVTAGNPAGPTIKRMYVYTGAATSNPRAFVLADVTTALDVYRAIDNTVGALLGQSMRWQVFADPNLKS
ncbi:MAG TPA: hypothetical protein VFT22_18915 [Kofleriaceae bacterium]|nr:hypothetical protein [Kofleriaceae bacterium]